MRRTPDTKIYDLDALVTYAVDQGMYDSTLRWQLVAGWSSTPTKWTLVSQDRSGSKWSSSARTLLIADELAEQILPFFPKPAQVYARCRTWLTLKSILAKLGKTDVGAQITKAQGAAKTAATEKALLVRRRTISNRTQEWLDTLIAETTTAEYEALSREERDVLAMLQGSLRGVLRAVPFTAPFAVGAAVTVPGDSSAHYERRSGVVLGVLSRTVRVDVVAKDGSASPMVFDAGQVRAI